MSFARAHVLGFFPAVPPLPDKGEPFVGGFLREAWESPLQQGVFPRFALLLVSFYSIQPPSARPFKVAVDG